MAITWNGGCGKGGGAIYTPGPGIQINSQNEISADVRKDMLALPETSPSESAHAVGEYLIYNNTLYRVTTAAAVGDALEDGTNITPVSIGDELAAAINDLSSLIKRVSVTKAYSVAAGGVVAVTNFYNETGIPDGYIPIAIEYYTAGDSRVFPYVMRLSPYIRVDLKNTATVDVNASVIMDLICIRESAIA